MQRLRRLARRRSSRTEDGAFVIDGPVLLGEALRAGVKVSSVFAESGASEEPVVAAVASGAERHLVHDGVLRKVLDVTNPQSVVAVAVQPAHDLDTILQAAEKMDSLVLGLVGVQDPGNAGTLIRVAEAAGCAGVVLTAGSVELWNPKTVRASAGALFRVPVVSGVEAAELIEAAGRVGLVCIATVARGATAPEDCTLGSAAVLLVGAESRACRRLSSSWPGRR